MTIALMVMAQPGAQLRAAAWESIFTHNMRRYIQVLHKRMAHVTTLITGPSGTGKELVARAIGRSRYLALGELAPGPDGHTDAETRDRDADALTGEAVDWVEKNLKDYPWPGNFRELSRCVRNVMIRGSYCVPTSPRDGAGGLGPIEELLHNARKIKFTADELLGCYYALAYSRSEESWAAAGRRIGVDYRTFQDRHDPAFLARLRRAQSTGGR